MTAFDDAVEAMRTELACGGSDEDAMRRAIPVLAQAVRNQSLPVGYHDECRPGLHRAADYLEGMAKDARS
jgi:hypothetical protein